MPNLFARAKAWLLGGRARRAPTFGPFSGSRPPRSGYVGYESPIRDVWLRMSSPCLDARTANSIYKDPEPQGGWQRSTGRNTKQPRGADHTSRPRDTEACDSSSQLTRHQTDGHLTRPIAPRRAQVRIAAAEEWQRKAAMCEQSGIRAWIRGLPPR